MKTTGVVPEAFAASISLLSRPDTDAMPHSSRSQWKVIRTLANQRRAHARRARDRGPWCPVALAGGARYDVHRAADLRGEARSASVSRSAIGYTQSTPASTYGFARRSAS